ncbi:magnesium chelatase subunit D [Rhodosalinus sediminis]|uniref:Mg-protoporphyrin IX chelatase n=1 Tax=Rhodosalinus sediminis TaxID=1940533 RepID=A0A3D9BWU3_9RHOB|nr:magnesium chelatase subunit D [Rhodosalinus sediminis]REC57821.1 magnesium chelatase subunit D [Rhodosalinus sediminis]
MSEGAARWARALRALALFAVDPQGLRGLTVRARVGPVRQRFEALLSALDGEAHRIHPEIGDPELYGGLDVTATLAAGRPVMAGGLADRPSRLILPMAERAAPDLAARLAQLLDASPGHSLVLLDEGAEPDERAPAALAERLALSLDLDGIGRLEAKGDLPWTAIAEARARLPDVAIPEEVAPALTALAARFGIDSLRAPLLALRAARAEAALEGRETVTEDDIRAAAELVYPDRATRTPEPPPEEDETPPEDTPEPEPESEQDDDGDLGDLPEEMLVEAVAALLPPDLLTRLAEGGATRAAKGSGAGAKRRGNRRGRPLPSRPGRPGGRERVDLVATLRAAAPWQTIRRRQQPDAGRVLVHASDVRLRRYEDRSDRLVIFAVDASGSLAMTRLNEAKGAVELLLGEAYSRRDHVALIAFRGTEAELLLPPTRSLVQTKRRLAALPGGGGTPLAAGLQAAGLLAHQSEGRGLSPRVALLTDGRANVALDGAGGRAQAMEDAARTARALRGQGLSALVIDTAARRGEAGRQLAEALGAGYLALPRADARRLSGAVAEALED